MIEAGFSAREIRQSLQKRIDRSKGNAGGAQFMIESEESDSEKSKSVDPSQSINNLSANMMNMGDMEMSEMSSVSNESWGGVSNAESLHSAQFRMRSLPVSIES